MAGEGTNSQLNQLYSIATNFVAPATLVSALLFYFGYVSSRAQYEYFGVDVDTIGLGTQDYVMRSPQPLLVPLLVLTLLGIAGVLVHMSIIRRVAAREPDESPDRRDHLQGYQRIARRTSVLGSGLIGTGVTLLFAYTWLRDWAWFDLVTPLLLATGAALVAYATRMQKLLRRPGPTNPPDPSADEPPAHLDGTARALRRSSTALLLLVVVANVFWSTATVAQWSGRGLAHYNATHLDNFPSVILDTRERLYLRDPGVEETALPAAAGQTFRYRYRHLRLLIQGRNRMFLVPDSWSASDSTLVVDLDGSVRVQFQFENEKP